MVSDNVFLLKELPFFSALSYNDLEGLDAVSRVKEYNKGKVIFFSGDLADKIYVVLSGSIKLFRETAEADEFVISLLSKGEIYGETAIFEGEHYHYSCEALEQSYLLEMPINPLKAIIGKKHDIALAMMTVMSDRSKKNELQAEHLSLMSTAQRVGCFLLRMCENQTNGSVDLKLPYDKTLIATSLAMKPETFSRALKQLKKTGVVVHGDSVTIDSIEILSDFCCIKCTKIDETCALAG